MSEQTDKKMTSGEALKAVYALLQEGGYDPVGQLVGYLLGEDPTYITNVGNARVLVRYIDRDELLKDLLFNYLKE